MFGKKMVKDYQAKKEDLVRSLVKKYPLYSLNKLAEELPDISRHAIQRILEKNSLSTVEKRIEFSKRGPSDTVRQIRRLWPKIGTFSFPKPLGIREGLEELSLPEQWRFLAIFLLCLGTFVFLKKSVWAKRPTIDLTEPKQNAVILGEYLYLSGTVEPRDVKIKVNSQDVSYNGDGSFTAVTTLSEGPNILKVSASNLTKSSEVTRLVYRQLTEEETRKKQEEEAKAKAEEESKRKEEEERLAAEVKALEAKAAIKDEARVEIVKQEVKTSGGVSVVTGEVVNNVGRALAYVHVLATFFNQEGNVVDVQYGAVEFKDKVLSPAGKASFETEPTFEEFKDYKLDVVWGR